MPLFRLFWIRNWPTVTSSFWHRGTLCNLLEMSDLDTGPPKLESPDLPPETMRPNKRPRVEEPSTEADRSMGPLLDPSEEPHKASSSRELARKSKGRGRGRERKQKPPGTFNRRDQVAKKKADTAAAHDGEEESGTPRAQRLPKRQCAVLLGFSGTGFSGMQMYGKADFCVDTR
jgi:hypothetical protein